jgi:hypothetical protein
LLTFVFLFGNDFEYTKHTLIQRLRQMFSRCSQFYDGNTVGSESASLVGVLTNQHGPFPNTNLTCLEVKKRSRLPVFKSCKEQRSHPTGRRHFQRTHDLFVPSTS